MSNYGLVPYNDELYHYGVPGMKWGIRRSDKSLRRNISKLGLKNANLDEKRKKTTKFKNLVWQLCPERAIISFDAIVAPN